MNHLSHQVVHALVFLLYLFVAFIYYRINCFLSVTTKTLFYFCVFPPLYFKNSVSSFIPVSLSFCTHTHTLSSIYLSIYLYLSFKEYTLNTFIPSMMFFPRSFGISSLSTLYTFDWVDQQVLINHQLVVRENDSGTPPHGVLCKVAEMEYPINQSINQYIYIYIYMNDELHSKNLTLKSTFEILEVT